MVTSFGAYVASAAVVLSVCKGVLMLQVLVLSCISCHKLRMAVGNIVYHYDPFSMGMP